LQNANSLFFCSLEKFSFYNADNPLAQPCPHENGNSARKATGIQDKKVTSFSHENGHVACGHRHTEWKFYGHFHIKLAPSGIADGG
jgi:hypothetical protein